jgi:peptidyl-prolyl cis-trans isomerase A (cyclophilin A)
MPLRLLTLGTMLTLTGVAIAASVQQPTGITGFVLDMTGGVIPGATIMLTPSSPSAVVKTISNDKGAYSFPGIPAGNYTLEFSLQGFQTITCTDVTVKGDAQAVVSTLLPLGVLEDLLGNRATLATPEPEPVKPPPICLRAGEVPVHIQMLGSLSYGAILVVDTAKAPATAENFLKYVTARAYDNGTLARVDLPVSRTVSGAPPRDASTSRSVIEGRISARFAGQLLAAIPIETTTMTGLRHKAGTVSMRRDTGVDTTTSTFMVLLADDPSLDAGGRRYADGKGAAAFGRVVSGMDDFRGLGSTPAVISSTTIPEPYRRRPSPNAHSARGFGWQALPSRQ